eukprot:SAG11_NODE_13525_length_651_cov_1.014493_2_plen_101_part_01
MRCVAVLFDHFEAELCDVRGVVQDRFAEPNSLPPPTGDVESEREEAAPEPEHTLEGATVSQAHEVAERARESVRQTFFAAERAAARRGGPQRGGLTEAGLA